MIEKNQKVKMLEINKESVTVFCYNDGIAQIAS